MKTMRSMDIGEYYKPGRHRANAVRHVRLPAMPIEIRRARPAESETLSQIAHAAKRHWGYPDGWIEEWKLDLTVTPEFIANHEVFVAIVNDAIAGCCALVVTGTLAEIEHMWIKPDHIGR